MLSGNRNFEGRVNPDVRANYLASPPLVVAYALAGSMQVDLVKEPLGTDTQGQAGLSERHLAFAGREVFEVITDTVKAKMFKEKYAGGVRGRRQLARRSTSPMGPSYAWDIGSTYVRNPALFRGHGE